MLREFKEFAVKGNIIDLAIGVIIGAATLNYGLFLNTVINFLIISFSIFLVIRQLNRFKKKQEPAPVITKECPYCFS